MYEYIFCVVFEEFNRIELFLRMLFFWYFYVYKKILEFGEIVLFE